MAIARVLIPGGIAGTLLVGLLIAVPFASGWEVATSIEALTVNVSPGLTVTGECKIINNETGEEVQTRFGECATGPSNWQIDISDQYWGTPSLFIESTPPKHTDFQGVQTENDKFVEQRTVTRQRDTYYLDYHVFMFEFRVKTEADVRVLECSATGQACIFDQETAYAAGGGDCLSDLPGVNVRCGRGGVAFAGSSFIAFYINPWQGARVAPEDTIRFGQWAGVMQAIVFDANAGAVQPAIPQDVPGLAVNILDDGAAANMFTLQGGGLPRFQFGTATLDDSIPQLVLIELPYKLLPGADITVGALGGVRQIVPADMFVSYKVRVDVLLVTGWQPQLDYIDSNSNGTRDTGEFTFIDKNEDNLWTAGTDEAVEGTPPSAQEATTTQSSESPPIQPESPPQTGSRIEPLGLPEDFRFPAPCEFFNVACWFNTAINFPSVTSIVGLLTVLAVIVVLIFGASIFLGRRRGR